MPNSEDPDYVNDVPADYDGERCQYVFENDWEFKRRSVIGRRCGLPMEPYEKDSKVRCCFHSTRSRRGDTKLKGKLEAAVAAGAYLGEALLPEGELQGANLWHANLHGAGLYNANLQGAFLPHANLQGANLYDATLEKADLADAKLQGADLRSARLHAAKLERANLYGAVLSFAKLPQASLWWAKLAGAHLYKAELVNADLRGATIDSLQEIDQDSGVAAAMRSELQEADLRGALLATARIGPEANLSDVKWGKRTIIQKDRWSICPCWRWSQYHIQDERCAHSHTEWEKIRKLHRLAEGARPAFSDCEAVYRQLKLNYQESGDYQTAGEFFVREMECKRAQMVKDGEPLLQRFWQALMYLSCGYGEWPGRIAKWALALVAFFALVHGMAGIEGSGKTPGVGPLLEWPTSWAGAWDGLSRWGTAFYFSVVTFTSLGYGDFSPANGWGRLAAGLEAALGIVIMSLFLICVVRKYSR